MEGCTHLSLILIWFESLCECDCIHSAQQEIENPSGKFNILPSEYLDAPYWIVRQKLATYRLDTQRDTYTVERL